MRSPSSKVVKGISQSPSSQKQERSRREQRKGSKGEDRSCRKNVGKHFEKRMDDRLASRGRGTMVRVIPTEALAREQGGGSVVSKTSCGTFISGYICYLSVILHYNADPG